MNHFVLQIQKLTQLPEQKVRSRLTERSGGCTDDAALCECAVGWIVELWHQERSDANAAQLWHVDLKFSQILKSYTVADIVRLMGARGESATSK